MEPMVVDISHWQGTAIDFKAIAEAGIVGVIHKATEGASYRDPNYAGNRVEAMKAGLLWGAYHFIRPVPIATQVQLFLSVAHSDGATLLALDHEDEAVSLAEAKLFLSEVMAATGIIPVIYSGHLIKQQVGTANDPELGRYQLWLAQYNDDPAQISWPKATWPSWFLWQYTEDGTIPGITGTVDLNAHGAGEADLIAEWCRPVGPVPETVDDLVVAIDIRAPPGARVTISINGEPQA